MDEREGSSDRQRLIHHRARGAVADHDVHLVGVDAKGEVGGRATPGEAFE